jgi:hypothetical protein
MKYKQIIALPILGLALSNLAFADRIPVLTPISSHTNSEVTFAAPQPYDYSFKNKGLTVSVASVTSGYQLTASGTGGFTFYTPTGSSYSGATTSTGYSLTANFDSDGEFEATNSLLTIKGDLASTPTGSTGTPAGILYSAQLTDFGYNAKQSAIAFTTLFNLSWSNQPLFTGGSNGEVVYLFDQVGLRNGGHGRLSVLIKALQNNNLGSITGKTYRNIESIATVPLPLPVVLFGTGLTALLGLGRKRRSNAKSIEALA